MAMLQDMKQVDALVQKLERRPKPPPPTPPPDMLAAPAARRAEARRRAWGTSSARKSCA